MKRKAVENVQPAKTKKKGLVATVQMVQEILVLNIYRDKILQGRYCMNTKTYEYQQWSAETEEWCGRKFAVLCGYETWYYSIHNVEKELKFNSAEEKELVEKELKLKEMNYTTSAVDLIDRRENDFIYEKRERSEQNRIDRINNIMRQMPALPHDIKDWIHKKTGAADFAFYDKNKQKWQCTNCGKSYHEEFLHRVDGGKKIRHNDMVTCPRCKKMVQVKRRTNKVEKIVHFMILQPVNDTYSVARHFNADIYWSEGKRSVTLEEAIRITLFKLVAKPKLACQIYYNQYAYDETGYFDTKNPANRKEYAGWLYEQGIEEALKDTAYSAWARLFCQLAAADKQMDYNRLMATQKDEALIRMTECLLKGRFDRLLKETSKDISLWSCEYIGPLYKRGGTIEEVFDISDRQKINRIRDLNGGSRTLSWMRWSDKTGNKIPQKTLQWLVKSNIEPRELNFIISNMSVTQIMNYVIRQQAGQYKNVRQVISQWEDYIKMCQRLKRHMDDEMVYRPRELKRRHDEAVAEIAAREAELEADDFNRRFPGAEDVLKEIKEKYEYAGSRYFIAVPDRLVDIVKEGRALHHCAGASDRYFDRIKQRETYICFLRKIEEPDVPYYTIEVEPGGTIRQHRGYLDEEPEIEEIRPFLREWQKEIKKRLNDEDRKYAEVSAVKRVENIEELKQKNNTRVLEGLMEDFMEAI